MMLALVFLTLFLVVAALLVLFVFSVFIPSIGQSDDGGMQGYIFAADEMRTAEPGRPPLSDTGLRAVVRCSSGKSFPSRRLDYAGLKDCRLFNDLYQSEFDCLYQCVGFGSCAAVCPQQAIRMENGTAVVASGCIGCGRCADACPKGVIGLFPRETAARAVRCCSGDDDTSCSAYKKSEWTELPERKAFKFWRICYNIFHGKDG